MQNTQTPQGAPTVWSPLQGSLEVEPNIAFHALVKRYAKEAGFSEGEIHQAHDLFARLVQITAIGASIELDKVYRQGPLERTVCMIDASLALDAKFLIGDSMSEEYQAYLNQPLEPKA